ncbi:MAG TPA: ABC transporter permease [Candidatus Acidoferrales bacterium]|nr:ABC transporter permease [Candidatus Acidoferrales bacterium]
MLLSDLRYAVRTLRKSPVFTIAAVLTMTLTIGANTAIFSVVNAVLIRPLPFAAPERLMQVAEKNDKLQLSSFGASVLNYLSWKEQQHSFEDLAAIGYISLALTGRGDPEQFQGNTISPSLVPVLGIRPVAGRNFREGEDRPGAEPAAIISEALWKRRFAADPAAIGAHIVLNGVSRTVVGVAPPALPFLTGSDIWIPLTINPGQEIRLNHVITVVGRLRPGVTQRQAQSEMDVVASRVGTQYPEVKDWGIRLIDFQSWIVSDNLRTTLLVLLSAVGLVLLIACANVANLLLSRAVSRQKEISVRAALGASRARILGQLLAESLLLSVSGGVAGLLAALWTVKLMNGWLPQGLLPVSEVSVDSTVLFFALAVTLVTGMLFGFVPAWHATQTDINTVLKQAGRSAVGGQRLPVRNGLVTGELALATILLIGAGLLVQSLARLQRVPIGFRPEGLLTFQIAPPLAKYPGQPRQWSLYRQVLQELSTLPGVRGAALSSGLPMGAGAQTHSPFVPSGRSVLPAGEAAAVDWRTVSPGFFRTMGIPFLSGRDFTEQDSPGAPEVIILSRRAAKIYWGDEDPIGKSLHRPTTTINYTVVGVVGDVRNTALNQESPTLYFTSTARVWPSMDVAVRTEGKPEAALPAVRRKVHDLDAELPLSNVRTMEDWVSNNAAQPRLNAALLGVFAGVALLIAAVGVYGVLAYSVSQRTREIGLRIALGAQQSGVLRWIVRQGMLVAAAGIAIGLAGAYALSHLLAALLFGVQPRDPLTFAAVAVLLFTIAFAACLVPARRASRVDPIVTLREE